MERLIQIVKDHCEFTKEEMEQETLVTGIINTFCKMLDKQQLDMFIKFMVERDKLETMKLNNHILTTHKICKEVFKLR